MPWNARTRVHEYGGKSYLPLPDGFVFANFGDQRLYRCGTAASTDLLSPEPLSPEPLTPAPGRRPPTGSPTSCSAPAGTRCGASGNGTVLAPRITRAIVAVPLDGSAAGDPAAIRVLVSGSDFYAYPAPSPDGTRLAWICWNHPRMPWDGTELRVAVLDGAGPVSDQSRLRCSWAATPSPCWPRSGGTRAACT